MSELAYWKMTEEGRSVLKEIQTEKFKIGQELSSGFLLSFKNNEELARVYAEKIGQLKGLDFIERLIQDDRNSTNEERDIV